MNSPKNLLARFPCGDFGFVVLASRYSKLKLYKLLEWLVKEGVFVLSSSVCSSTYYYYSRPGGHCSLFLMTEKQEVER